MKKYLLLVLTLIPLSLFSQELKHKSKLDSLNNLIAMNNEQIKILEQKNKVLTSEVKVALQEIDSLSIAENKTNVIYSTRPVALYRDIIHSKLIEDIPTDAKVVILEDIGDKYKVIYQNSIGYAYKFGFITEFERNKNLLKKDEEKKALDIEYVKNQKAYEVRKKELIKKYGSYFGKLISERRIAIGMTNNMVIESIGKPDDINRTVGSWGVNEQWVYDVKGLYIYFKNGKVTSFQD